MPYFNEADDTPTKIGKPIGDAMLRVADYLGIAGFMLYAAFDSLDALS
jgi:hypothetical protein